MRILIPITQLPVKLDNIKGGVHSALVNLLNGFALCEIKVRVLSFSREVSQETIIPFSENIQIHYVPEGNFKFHLLNYWFNGPKLMRKQIDEFKPDLVHFQEGNSFFLIKPKAYPLSKTLVTIHGFALEEAKRKKRLKDKITWLVNGWLNPLLSPNNMIHLSEFSIKLTHSNGSQRNTIIRNAIKNVFFDVPLKNKQENRLLYLGIIDNNKNLIFTLEILYKLRELGLVFHLDVMGGFSNPEYELIITQFIKEKKLEDQISFHGWVNQTQVLEQLKLSDMLIVSSKHESLPMAIAESMAAGKVVLASAVGGIPEMLENEKSGFLFHLNNEAHLIECLKELHSNHTLVHQISSEARAHAYQNYHCSHVAKSTIAFYQTILTEQ
jgi:glycosyltransferase involved in cell wall biosynthesis